MSKEIEKWWDEAAENYQKGGKLIISIGYGPGSHGESYWKLLGTLKGKNALEIGCGGAQCGIAMAKQGANVIGIDISREQLKFAEKLAKKNKVKIRLIQGDIKNLKPIKSNSQDVVFTAYALMYVDDLPKCFKEVYRTLKKGGIFVLSLEHPFYSVINEKTLKIGRTYFDTGKETEKDVWEDGSVHLFAIYHFTFSQIVNALADSGLVIKKMIEPDPRTKYKGRDAIWHKWQYQPGLMKKIPATLIIKARK